LPRLNAQPLLRPARQAPRSSGSTPDSSPRTTLLRRTASATGIVLLLCLLPGATAQAESRPRAAAPTASLPLPRNAAFPGGVVRVDLGWAANSPRPKAWFGESRLRLQRWEGRWQALVGLPLTQPPGRHEVRSVSGSEEKRIPFAVSDKAYPVQRITLADDSRVRLSAADTLRAEREAEQIAQLKSHWRDLAEEPAQSSRQESAAARTTYQPARAPAAASPLAGDATLQLPVAGRASGNFGVRRVFNGEERSPHAGLDIAAGRGQPVRNAAAGVVLATGDYFFSGKAVFVDHGEGLITLYAHLDRIDVRPGESVAPGQTLGSVGATGRASGPHLHWGVFLNGSAVDPRLFVPAKATAGRSKVR